MMYETEFDSNEASDYGGAIYVGIATAGGLYVLQGNFSTTFTSNKANGLVKYNV